MRQHAKDITGRWARTSRAVPLMRQPGMQLAHMAKGRSSEAFFGCDDPLESVIFSALLGIRKIQDDGGSGVDP